MYSFGSGVLIGTRTDIANATPVNFGLVQEVTIDETATIKELYGQQQHPLAIARGTIKTTGKAKVARISGLAIASLFYGVALVPGQVMTAFGEAGTIPADKPYAVTTANAATAVDDLGVLNALTGLPFTRVATAPAPGQYSVANGVYTFAADDKGKSLLINYTYVLAGAGQRFTVTNQLLGTTPTFSAQFYTTFQGNAVNVKFNNCTSSKLGFGTKLEDFVMPEFDFSVFADAAGNVATWSFGDVG
ncbi:hypothetical protein QO001_002202 [Methylobacterium brachiatum]|uniref:Uncharacterized protein n=1 Tax=Methylobacterium brachiatum TaxID=269660 RepID=A0AAJ1TRD3_9HYPH|nr:hypothetical protein [Methylobacterium brachiatum]MCB4802650.1 hypothetical protein [Methylobacterium brachiatum]MDQ0543276.1 hypothetical protein [Methylobacterium brachiatum]